MKNYLEKVLHFLSSSLSWETKLLQYLLYYWNHRTAYPYSEEVKPVEEHLRVKKGKVVGQYMGFGLSLIPLSWSLLLDGSLYFTKHTHGCYWLTLISLWYWASLGDGVKASVHLNTMSHSHSSWQPRGIWPWIYLEDNENRQEWKLFRPASPALQPSYSLVSCVPFFVLVIFSPAKVTLKWVPNEDDNVMSKKWKQEKIQHECLKTLPLVGLKLSLGKKIHRELHRRLANTTF